MVSVIITTYKGTDFLKRSIDSALCQDYPFFEVIVVDDNPPDSEERKITEQIMAQYYNNDKIGYIKHYKNLNGAAARNTGVKNCKGKYVSFLDNDDEYYPERLSKLVATLMREEADIVFSDVVIKKDGQFCKYITDGLSKDNFFATLTNENIIGTGSNLFLKKDVYIDCGGFDERLIRNQDVDFLLSVFSKGKKAAWIKEALVIKNDNSFFNVPSYQEMVCIKRALYKKYFKQIKKYSKREKKKIHIALHRSLLMSAIQKNDSLGIKKERILLGPNISIKLFVESLVCGFPKIYGVMKDVIYFGNKIRSIVSTKLN